MNELVKKELREYGIPAAALLVALCTAWMILGSTSYVLFEPHAEASVLVVLGAALAGVAIGYAQFTVERSRGTLAYLVHRSGGYAELFRAKARAGLALALCIGMLPPVVFGAAKLLGPYAPLVQSERIVEHALAGLVAIPAWGAGVLVALFSRSLLASLVSGLLAALGVTLVASVLPLPVTRMSMLAPIVFLLVVFTAGWLVLRFARGVFASAIDRDGSLAWKRQLACALLALPLFVQPLWILASGVATSSQYTLFNSYPELVRAADGSFRLEDPASLFAARSRALDPDGPKQPVSWIEVLRPAPGFAFVEGWQSIRRYPRTPLGGMSSPLRWELQYSRWSPDPKPLRDKQGRSIAGPAQEFAPAGRVYLDRGEGLVRIACGLDLVRRGEEPDRGYWSSPRTVALERSGASKRLSPGTLVIGEYGSRPLFLDLADKTFWTVDFAESGERLAEVALPEGDTLVDSRPMCDAILARNGTFNIASTSAMLFVGEHANYIWGPDGFRVPEPGSVFDDEAVRASMGCEWRVESPRMDTLTVEVRSTKDASPLYAHTFEPQTSEQRVFGAIARVGGLLAPPTTSVVQLLGLASAMPAGGMTFVFARSVVDTTAYHLGHIGLGLVAGLLAWSWVARRGGSTREKLLWGVFCGGFGVFALLFLVLLAPRSRALAERSGREQPVAAAAV